MSVFKKSLDAIPRTSRNGSDDKPRQYVKTKGKGQLLHNIKSLDINGLNRSESKQSPSYSRPTLPAISEKVGNGSFVNKNSSVPAYTNGNVCKPLSLLQPGLNSTSQAKQFNQRFECKWCRSQRDGLIGEECVNCMKQRCRFEKEIAMKILLSSTPNKHDDGAKAKGSLCRKIEMCHWDSSLAWSHRIGLEQRLVQSLPSVEKARRHRSIGMRQNVAVIVIGAGMAGLSAADSLLRDGFKNVIVLEASYRIGGRVHTVTCGPGTKAVIDLGVSEIDQPTEWNSVFILAKKQGLIEEGPSSMIQGFGQPPSALLCDERQALFYNMMINHEITTLAELKSKNRDRCHNDIQLSSKNYFRETLRRLDQHIEQKGYDKNPGLICPGVKATTAAHCKDLQFQHGDDKGDADIQGFTPNKSDSYVFVKGGMASILQHLTKKFKPSTIKLRARVNHIDWSDCTQRNIEKGKDPRVIVTCCDGRVFKAHHIIITVPLGFLKSNAQCMFCPSLPESKLNAIGRLGFGAVCKAFIQYEKPLSRYGFYNATKDSKNGDVATKSEIEKYILNLKAKPQSCIVQASFSNSLPEKMNDDDLLNDLTRILERNLSKAMPKPVKFTKTNWKGNSLYMGTHPYIITSENHRDASILAQPISVGTRPIIQFAGDATHNDYTSLLHAARTSGLREAELLINTYDNLYGWENLNNN